MTVVPATSRGSQTGGGGITVITSTVLGSPAATLDFSSIPATYTHLLLHYALRSAVAGETASATPIRLNGDSGANYSVQHIWGHGAVADAALLTAQTSMSVLVEAGPNAAASLFGTGAVVIPFYATGTMQRTLTSQINLLPSGNTFGGVISGIWSSTAAINRITIFASDLASNLAAGSGATLYGLT